MRIVLIADTFPPLRNSGAVQLRDLAREFARQGHDLTVLLPSAGPAPWQIEDVGGVQILRLRAPRTKDIGYIRRTLGEMFMPFAMWWNLRKSPVAGQKWDGVIWYAPSIFHGPLVKRLKRASGCKSYLIIRDIFPEWAVDMGLMARGLVYRFFNAVAQYQYGVADVIGIQTPGNAVYFDAARHKVEVLPNWLDAPAQKPCAIRLVQTPLAGRRVFVYAGNMGVAQGLDIVLDLAEKMQDRHDVGFLFVGRGSDAARLRGAAQERGLTNTLFYDEIDPDEIPDLYAQCAVGIVALDHRHKSHNIPGKFLTYMQSGLPVLANVNAGNDIAQMIRTHQVGVVCEDNQLETLYDLTKELLSRPQDGASDRCKALFAAQFSVAQTVRQIVAAL